MATAEPVPPSTKPIAQPSVSNEVPTSNTAAKTSPSKQNQIIAAGLPSKAADKTYIFILEIRLFIVHFKTVLVNELCKLQENLQAI